VPLDYSLELRDTPINGNIYPRAREFMEGILAFRKSWIEITSNGSGDDLFYDPDRISATSSFFYHPHDDVQYHFYPCIGNYIQSLLDLHASGSLAYRDRTVVTTHATTYEDEIEFIDRYGKHIR
jgi:hypothetical protein